MTNTAALRQWVEKKGYKYKKIAEILGVTPYTLQLKIDNVREFKASEVNAFSEELGMGERDRNEIFFAKNVELISTR